MTRKTKSIKGEEVDFDLLETKQKIEQNKPRVMEVREREDFVHKRRKNRGRSSAMQKIRENKTNKNDINTTKEENKKTATTKKSKNKKRTIVKKENSTTDKGIE